MSNGFIYVVDAHFIDKIEERKKSWTQVPVQSTGKLATTSRVHPFRNLQTRARTHAVLAIGLYELLGT
jgi:hypothetical protein